MSKPHSVDILTTYPPTRSSPLHLYLSVRATPYPEALSTPLEQNHKMPEPTTVAALLGKALIKTGLKKGAAGVLKKTGAKQAANVAHQYGASAVNAASQQSTTLGAAELLGEAGAFVASVSYALSDGPSTSSGSYRRSRNRSSRQRDPLAEIAEIERQRVQSRAAERRREALQVESDREFNAAHTRATHERWRQEIDECRKYRADLAASQGRSLPYASLALLNGALTALV